MTEKAVLLQDVSPHGNLQALVEADGKSVHFYIWSAPSAPFGVRSCWVRNLAPAPETMEVEAMKRGEAPMLPRAACAHPDGAPLPSSLSVVWLEEGDGAALLEGGEILAVIPAWSGLGEFRGYARDCVERTSLCWPLGTPQENRMHARVRASLQKVKAWEGSLWADFKLSAHKLMEEKLGKPDEVQRADAHWPPREILKFSTEKSVMVLTVGVSLRPQPRVEMAMEDASDARRIELGCALSSENMNHLPAVMDSLKHLSHAPWQMFTWLGDGHALPWTALPDHPYVLLAEDPPDAPELSWPPFDDGRVKLLWLIPLTAEDRAVALSDGAAALKTRLWSRGVTHIFGAF